MEQSSSDDSQFHLVDGVIVGNVYDKYATGNPIARRMMAGFLKAVADLYRRSAPRTVLEVGCGEGLLAQHLLGQEPRPNRFEACDLSIDLVRPDIDRFIKFRTASVYNLPYDSGEFDLVVCCEVLEHLERPERAMEELARVTRRGVLISTPREPLWRILNLLRGRYALQLGNTPGHIQHYNGHSLRRLIESRLRIVAERSPLPWVVMLAELDRSQATSAPDCSAIIRPE